MGATPRPMPVHPLSGSLDEVVGMNQMDDPGSEAEDVKFFWLGVEKLVYLTCGLSESEPADECGGLGTEGEEQVWLASGHVVCEAVEVAWHPVGILQELLFFGSGEDAGLGARGFFVEADIVSHGTPRAACRGVGQEVGHHVKYEDVASSESEWSEVVVFNLGTGF